MCILDIFLMEEEEEGIPNPSLHVAVVRNANRVVKAFIIYVLL